MTDNIPLLLRDIDAAEIVRVSRSSWWRGVRRGTWPKPVYANGLTRWHRHQVLAAIAALPSERDDGEAA